MRLIDALGIALCLFAAVLSIHVYTQNKSGACIPSIREMPQPRPILT